MHVGVKVSNTTRINDVYEWVYTAYAEHTHGRKRTLTLCKGEALRAIAWNTGIGFTMQMSSVLNCDMFWMQLATDEAVRPLKNRPKVENTPLIDKTDG